MSYLLFCRSLVSLLCLAGCAFTLWFLLSNGSLCLNAGKLGIDHDTTTILAYDNLLVHLNIELSLWWNLIEATTASIALHIDHSQSVAHTLANTLKALQQSWFNQRL